MIKKLMQLLDSRNGILFLIVSGVFAYYGYLIGGWGWLLWWSALSFLTVACGYLGLGAKIFGKRTDGTIAWHVLSYLLPYLLHTWAI